MPNESVPSNPPPSGQSHAIIARWPEDLVADGFAPVSSYFLDRYSQLVPPLTHSEAMLVVHLIRYKWTSAAPYPSFKTLAKQMGISAQMARAHARSLETKGCLTREFQKGATNRFHLEPLFSKLQVLRRREHSQRATAAAAQGEPPGG